MELFPEKIIEADFISSQQPITASTRKLAKQFPVRSHGYDDLLNIGLACNCLRTETSEKS